MKPERPRCCSTSAFFWANKKPNKNCRDLLNYFFKQNVSALHSQLFSGDVLAPFTQHKLSHRMQLFSCGSAFYMATTRWLRWNIRDPVPEWNATPLPAVYRGRADCLRMRWCYGPPHPLRFQSNSRVCVGGHRTQKWHISELRSCWWLWWVSRGFSIKV